MVNNNEILAYFYDINQDELIEMLEKAGFQVFFSGINSIVVKPKGTD